MSYPSRTWRLAFARFALSLALMFVVWLPLGILDVVPFALDSPGESSLRVHTAAAVLCLIIAAWAFWE